MNFKMVCNVKKNEILNKSLGGCSCMMLQLQGKKNECLLKIISFLFLLTIAMSNIATAATYYIDASNGNDSRNGSSTNPWRTINKAKTSVYAGDIVNLRPGNYGSVTFTSADRLGNSGNYITYQNDPDSVPYSAKFSRIFFSGNTNFYITVAGFDVQNNGTADSCIKIENASYVKVIDCKAHGQAGGIGPSYANILCTVSDNVLIEGCEIYYTGAWAHALQMEGSDTVTARGNHIHDTISSGIRTGGGQNYVIENNIIHDQRSDWNADVHGSGISIHSHDTKISGNIVYNYGNSRPIRFYQSYAGANGYRNMTVENNLVYKTPDFEGTQWWVEFIDVGPNFIFRNNTIMENVVLKFAVNVSATSMSIHNNVINGNFHLQDSTDSGGGHAYWDSVSEGNNLFRWLTSGGCGYQCSYDEFSATSNSIVGANFDVGSFFKSGAAHYPYNGNYPYQLADYSIAIDFGNDNNAPQVDLLGNDRLGPPDAGCYEYGSDTGQPINNPPVANAGQNQTLTDNDGNGTETITLNASGSTDSDGTIINYIWKENGNQIASGIATTVSLATGQHIVTLTVTDDKGSIDSDSITITIDENVVDVTPPDIVSFTPSINSLEITFSENLNKSSAENVNSYHIDPGVSITQATLNSSENIVTLITSTHTLNDIYTLTCSGISDISGNTTTQISKDYIYSPNLVGFWNFDEGNGSTAEDLSSKSNTGSLVNGPTWTTFETLDFDGVDDYVTCGNDQSLNIMSDLTISACINLTSFGQNGWGRIVDKGNGSNGFSFFVEEATGSIVYVVYGGNMAKSNPGIVELNKWQHVTTVFDNSAKTVTFYLDGTQVGSSSYTTPPVDSSSSPLVIGIRNHDSNRAFDGQIDNVRIYNKALNDQDVSDIYSSDYPVAFYPINDKTVDENSTLNFEVITINENVNVQLQTHNLPSEPQFINNIFNWTPITGNAGSYQATFYAAQGQIEDFETITITVNSVNSPPVFNAIGNKSVDEDKTLTFTVNATDPDNDTITYSAAGLPSGAAFNGNTFNWTPQFEQAGTYTPTFIANDGHKTASQTITITVNNINRSPVLSAIGDKSVVEGQTLNFTVNATDPDNNTITYSANGLPNGATLAGNTFNWTPQTGQAGTYTATFIATDGQETVSKTINIIVEALPVNSNEVIIDNGDPQTSYTGTWEVSGGSSPYGTDSVWSRDGATYSWTFTPSVSGQYDVSMCWSGWSTRSNNVPVDIEDISGTNTVYIDQSKNAGRWNSLAACSFQAGNSYKVIVTSQPAPSSTCADAVKFTFISDLPEPQPEIIIDGTSGFTYSDDMFRNSSKPAYASGTRLTDGSLKVDLGGIDKKKVYGISGGWRSDFSLDSTTNLRLTLKYNLTQSASYESDEYSEVLISINGIMVGSNGNDYVARIVGDGNKGSSLTTGWQQFQIDLGSIPAGTYTITIGGYNNKKTYSNEYTDIVIDEILLSAQ